MTAQPPTVESGPEPSGRAGLRLVEWNIAMGLAKKAHPLAGLRPTIAVLPECAHLSQSMPILERLGATDGQWVGSLPNKGLAVFTFDGWTLDVDDSYDPGYPWLLPLHVRGPQHLPLHLRLLAVWEMNQRGKGYESARRQGGARASVEHYTPFLTGEADAVLVSGDFNNAVLWDRPRKTFNFADLIAAYANLGLTSAYHHVNGCEQGEEADPTHWWRRSSDTTFHIDYTFISTPESVTSVSLGAFEDWIAYSDHSPMTLTLDLTTAAKATAETGVSTGMAPR